MPENIATTGQSPVASPTGIRGDSVLFGAGLTDPTDPNNGLGRRKRPAGKGTAFLPEPGARGFCGRLADFFYLDEVLYLELAVTGMAGTSTRAGF